MSTLRRSFIAALGALAALPAMAQEVQPPAAGGQEPVYETVKVRMETTAGDIVIALETERAPKTAANFLRYVDRELYDGGTFYRAIHEAGVADYGLLQGGLRGSGNRPLDPVEHEPTTLTGLSHTAGAISLARGEPGSGNAEFFIMIGDTTGLDADPSAPGDNAGYAVFGRVVEGMDVVRTIQLFPKSAEAEVPSMRGQMLETPIKIRSIRRVEE